jgi:hypothetical protein
MVSEWTVNELAAKRQDVVKALATSTSLAVNDYLIFLSNSRRVSHSFPSSWRNRVHTCAILSRVCKRLKDQHQCQA